MKNSTIFFRKYLSEIILRASFLRLRQRVKTAIGEITKKKKGAIFSLNIRIPP